MAMEERMNNPDEIDISELEALSAQLDQALNSNERETEQNIEKETKPYASVSNSSFSHAHDMDASIKREAVSSQGDPARQRSSVQRARFAPLAQEANLNPTPSNMDLLMDITLRVSVELGRATLSVRDTLNLSPGQVIELDKLAGDPVDVLINGRLIARGEVVVVDDQFGVRITEIVSPRQRVEAMR